jgi:hypothetical protein
MGAIEPPNPIPRSEDPVTTRRVFHFRLILRALRPELRRDVCLFDKEARPQRLSRPRRISCSHQSLRQYPDNPGRYERI